MAKHTHKWTPEKIAAFSYSQLLDMKQKAITNDASDVLAMCEFELSTRPPPEPPKPKVKRTYPKAVKLDRSQAVRDFEKIVASKIETVGKELLEIYDLSTETARKLSLGARAFKPHRLLSAVGKAKVGGAQKAGLVAFDRYASYRLKEEVYALLAILDANKEPESTRFQVIAPERLVPNFKPLSDLRSHLEDGDVIGFAKGGIEFNTFDEASEFFKSIIDNVAPKKKSS
jgi:hypothetical protein